jgi:hypothetical protein
MTFAFVAKHRHIWPVSWMCAVLGVSRSGFHAWLRRPISERAAQDAKLVQSIDKSFKASDRTYGARRVWRDVLEEGLACGLHRIERLMRLNAMRARPKRRGNPKDDGERSVIADNILDRDFAADRPNQKWLADFTYIWTAEGWIYVAVVLDLFSRRVVGWSMKAERDASLVMDALIPLIDCYAINCRAMDGCLAPRQGRRAAPPLGPGVAIHQRTVPAPASGLRNHLLNEPCGQCLGQLGNGELLLVAEDRTDSPQGLPHP